MSISTFKCPSSGIYWFTYTASWDGNIYANVFLTGTGRYPAPQLMRMHTLFDKEDTLSGNSIHELTLGQQIKMFTIYEMSFTNNQNGFSWGAFRLDSLMSHLVVFDITIWLLYNRKKYIVNINAGNGWSSETNTFNAMTEGIHYFSLSIGAQSSMQTYFTTQGFKHCALRISYEEEQLTDISSRGYLLHLKISEIVALQFMSRKNIVSKYSSTSFRGFFYSPINKEFAVAWSVHFNTEIDTLKKLNLKFDEILLDTHKSWNTTYGELVIPVSGKYLLELVGTSSNAMDYSQGRDIGRIDINLSLNRTNTLFLLQFASFRKSITRSRSAIVALERNDRLSVMSLSCNREIMSGANFQGVSFQGFLLYPD